MKGNCIRSSTRIADLSKNTVTKLLEDAGKACAAYHDDHVRGVNASPEKADEICSFHKAKGSNVAEAMAVPVDAGDTWTWMAMDRDSTRVFIPRCTTVQRQLRARAFLIWRIPPVTIRVGAAPAKV